MEPLLVDATYEGGVLKPDRPLPLNEHERVRISVGSLPVHACEEISDSPLRSNGPIGWTEASNARRCELIDLQIQSTITPDEAAELGQLQRALRCYLDQMAPLGLEGARRIHAELLERRSTK